MASLTEADLAELLGPNRSAYRRYGEWFDYTWGYFGDTCAYCQGMARVQSANKWGHVMKTLDHFKPVSKGGTDDRWNFIPACQHCNSAKGGREALAWYWKQSFFTLDRWARIMNYITLVKTLPTQ